MNLDHIVFSLRGPGFVGKIEAEHHTHILYIISVIIIVRMMMIIEINNSMGFCRPKKLIQSIETSPPASSLLR